MLKRVLIFIAGIVFFILGIIGLLIPVVPQVPFFVASLLAFISISRRLKRKFKSSRIYQKYMKKHLEEIDFINNLLKDEEDKEKEAEEKEEENKEDKEENKENKEENREEEKKKEGEEKKE